MPLKAAYDICGMMKDIYPNLMQYNPQAAVWPQGQGHGLRIFMFKFCIKVLEPHDFQTILRILCIYSRMIDIGTYFYTVSSPNPCMTSMSRSRT